MQGGMLGAQLPRREKHRPDGWQSLGLNVHFVPHLGYGPGLVTPYIDFSGSTSATWR